MKKLLCKFAYWILYHCEVIDVFAMRFILKSGTYKVTEVIQNHDFSEVTIKAKRESLRFQ